MESRLAEVLAVVKRRVPDPIKRRIPPAVKQRIRDVVRQTERRLQRARPAEPPTGSAARVRLVGRRLTVTAESLTAARSAAASLDHGQAATGVDITVSGWQRPYPGWSGRIGSVPGLLSHSVQLPRARKGRARVRMTVAKPVSAQQLLDAALSALDPARSLPATLTAAVLVDGPRPPWLRAAALPVDGRPPSREAQARKWASAPSTDVRLTSATDASTTDDPVAVYSRYGLIASGKPGRVLLDISFDNPMGRGPGDDDPRSGLLTLDVNGGGDITWRVLAGGNRSDLVVAGHAGDPLDSAQRAALVGLRSLAHGSLPDCEPAPHAAVLAQLAATGVAMTVPTLSPEVRELLGPELAELLTAPLPLADADPIEWDARSVAQRRAAMREHDVGLNPTPARLASALPTVTAIVVSRRPYLIRRVADVLASQTYPRLDVVVALHGTTLDAPEREWLASKPIPFQVIELPAELSLGEALSEATLRAPGSLITKVDDDDQYGPEHIWDLVLARRYSGATVVGKGPEFVHFATQGITIRRDWTSETFTNVVAGGTIMIARGDLEAVGGWRPVPRSVDRTLLERVLHGGGLVYRTHPYGFVYTRHDDGHTWDPGGEDFFLRTAARQWNGLPPALLGPHLVTSREAGGEEAGYRDDPGAAR